MSNLAQREKLADAARSEVTSHIMAYPDRWAEEIAEDIVDKDAFILAAVSEATSSSRCETARQAVRSFAERAGQSAYNSIIQHPGII